MSDHRRAFFWVVWGEYPFLRVLRLAVSPLRPSLSRSLVKMPQKFSQDDEAMWAEVLARFEKKAPASVMAKLA
ncbi:hypothetical protein, partial [Pseudomonas kribbensis]|uniref:hypothetical protein n=1 Tax=Pseudomonas kribbensis TaxID=1628086 RepID=UPI001981D5FF